MFLINLPGVDMFSKTFVVWDLGATKCAAAIVDFDIQTDELNCIKSCRIKLTDCQTIDELVDEVEAALEFDISKAEAICIAAAGRYNGTVVELEEGYPYAMEFDRVSKERNWRNMEVVHDYVPVACATYTSYLKNKDNVKTIVKGKRQKLGRRVVMGVGTGLGLKDTVLLPNGDFWLGENEAGHVGLSHPPKALSESEGRHREFIRFLRDKDGLLKGDVLTYEKILSGKGLSRIHHFLTGNANCEPENISDGIAQGIHDETLDMIAWYLGLFVGTVQLMFMPSGGIWISGGVVQKNMDIFEHDAFMKGINASPAYKKDRELFPLRVMCGPDCTLLGCAYYASRRMLKLPPARY